MTQTGCKVCNHDKGLHSTVGCMVHQADGFFCSCRESGG